MEEEYLSNLNEAQYNAVINTDGPVLVNAGAGSGKTRVLTVRIAHLLKQGVNPWNILALTFTNKAAKEMKERIGKIVDERLTRALWMGTFHSIFGKILRLEASKLGYTSQYIIYDTADQKSLMKKIVKDLQLDNKTYKENVLLSYISEAKNDLLLPNDYAKNINYSKRDKLKKIPAMPGIYAEYMKRCKEQNAMDFDDLLLNTSILLRTDTEALNKYSELFQYILVDEYQDTNKVQYSIIKLLAGKHHNICVVGDDAQSIYSFRGARIENILNFGKDYHNYRVFNLEQNYRSTQNIVNAAQSLIKHNNGQLAKQCFSEREEGFPIIINSAATTSQEATLVVKEILLRIKNNGLKPKDFAVLYRINAQSNELEKALRMAGLPYRIFGGTSFYQRKEIKDILAYCRIAINTNDTVSLLRIINEPKRSIGDTTIDKIDAFAREHDMQFYDVIAEEYMLQQVGLTARTNSSVLKFTAIIKQLEELTDTTNAFDFVKELLKLTTLDTYYGQDTTEEGKERWENITELTRALKEFCILKEQEFKEGQNPELNKPDWTIGTFLQDIALMTSEDDVTARNNTDYVSLMTIHASKGLEFNTVIISGAEDEKFPGMRANENPMDLEEERRLMYVAITRAENESIITYAQQTFIYGQFITAKPTRFISEIEGRTLKRYDNAFGNMQNGFRTQINKGNYPASPKVQYPAMPKPTPATAASTSNVAPAGIRTTDFKEGDKVVHDKFGRGIIEKIDGSGMDSLIHVNFDSAGRKTLLLKFSRMRKI